MINISVLYSKGKNSILWKIKNNEDYRSLKFSYRKDDNFKEHSGGEQDTVEYFRGIFRGRT